MKHLPEVFQKNLDLYSKKFNGGQKVSLPPLSTWEFCETGKKKQLNLKKKGKEYYLYSSTNIDVEVRQWVGLFPLHQVEWLIVYGMGLGYYYEAILPWLREKENRKVIFFEDDPEVLRSFLELDIATSFLADPQAELFFISGAKNEAEIFKNLINRTLLSKKVFTALNAYDREKTNEYKALKLLFDFDRLKYESHVGEFLTKGETFLPNFYSNILNIDQAILGTHFFGLFKDVPAIICGAGPSLHKNIELLSTLKDKAVILAGGTAVNALNAYGVNPHFGIGVDPYQFHFSRTVANTALEVPYFYRNRMNVDAVEALTGPLLYLPGASSYSVSEWYEKKLEIPPLKLDEGNNVINMSLSIASLLGCRPIIAVGVDLAYSNNQSYAPGISAHGIHDPKEQFITKNPYEDLLLGEDIFGKPVYTLMKWILEANWFSFFARTHPETTFINATEGGIGFPGVPNIPLNVVKEKYLTKSYEIEGIVQAEIAKETAPIVSDQVVNEPIKDLSKSLKNCFEKLSKLQILAPNWNNKNFEPEGEALTVVKEIESEVAYQNLLKDFDTIYQSFLKSERVNNETKVSGRWAFILECVIANLKYIQTALQLDFKKRSALAVKKEQNTPKISASSSPSKENGFIDNGNLQVLSKNKNGELDGVSEIKDREGHLLWHANYVDGKKEGEVKAVYPNGKLYKLQEFKAGIPVNHHYTFYVDGVLKSDIPYVEGKWNGTALFYYPNGALKRVIEFQNGKKSGQDIYYGPDNQPFLTASYLEGLPIGVAAQWHSNGVKSIEAEYSTPGVLSRIQRWDKKGQAIDETAAQKDYFDTVTKQSLTIVNSLEKMVTTVENLFQPNKKDIPSDVMEDFKEEFLHLQEDLKQFNTIANTLLKESGVNESKESLWKTPEAERELKEYFSIASDSMQESILKLQGQIRNLRKDIKSSSEGSEDETHQEKGK